jgi:hypothetical protein
LLNLLSQIVTLVIVGTVVAIVTVLDYSDPDDRSKEGTAELTQAEREPRD